MKLCKLQSTGAGVHHITVPEAYRKELGWEKGDYVHIRKDGDTLILTKIEVTALG